MGGRGGGEPGGAWRRLATAVVLCHDRLQTRLRTLQQKNGHEMEGEEEAPSV